MTTADEVAEKLYGLPPAEFTATRDAHAKQAKADGDRELATQIGQLRKPTAAAWLVNLLVREDPDSVDALIDLGGDLRQAQLRLSGEELKALSVQRARVVQALARKAVAYAKDKGERAAPSAVEEVRQTLQAALADPDVGDQVRAGRLLTSASYSGFGPAKLSVVRSSDSPPPARKAPAKPSKPEPPKPDPAKIAKAQQAYDDATAALGEAERASTTARASVDEADEAERDAVERIQQLRADLRTAERDEHDAKRAKETARKDARAADRERGRAQKAADDAEFALERAKRGRS